LTTKTHDRVAAENDEHLVDQKGSASLYKTRPALGHRSPSYSAMVTNAWSQVHTQNFSLGEGKGDAESKQGVPGLKCQTSGECSLS